MYYSGVCLSVSTLFSQAVSQDYSSHCFQILYSDYTNIEDMQRHSFLLKNENCQNYRILKTYEALVNI